MQTPAPFCQRLTVPILVFLILIDVVVCAQPEKRGVLRKSPETCPGYTLIAPFGGQKTFLIDLDGNDVHSWITDRKPSQAAYLLEDGSLLRTAKIPSQTFNIPGGPAGGIQRISWDGELLWDYEVADAHRLSHHDIEPMPNGNVLVVAWDLKTRHEAIAAGRDPAKIENDALWPETVLEIKPVGRTGGEVVWEWNLWDHLVQSFDKSKPNFGQPADHPELIDLNYVDRPIADWIHMNSIDYNPQLDQILLCGRTFDELWIIDHGTTTAEAAKHSGGRYGQGGDVLYRWGNPFAWFAGSPFDQVLFGQHDPHWIPPGLPGAGNILIFNNGSDRDQRSFSTVDELTPPQKKNGTYQRSGQGAYGPKQLTWQFKDPDSLFSQRVSGAQRLPNGNTLICSGETGHVFEVDRDGTVVWDYRNELGATPQNRQAKGGAPTSLGGVAMFRATRYAPDYAAFKARDLTPEEPTE